MKLSRGAPRRWSRTRPAGRSSAGSPTAREPARRSFLADYEASHTPSSPACALSLCQAPQMLRMCVPGLCPGMPQRLPGLRCSAASNRSEESPPRDRRRPHLLADIFETEVVPIPRRPARPRRVCNPLAAPPQDRRPRRREGLPYPHPLRLGLPGRRPLPPARRPPLRSRPLSAGAACPENPGSFNPQPNSEQPQIPAPNRVSPRRDPSTETQVRGSPRIGRASSLSDFGVGFRL